MRSIRLVFVVLLLTSVFAVVGVILMAASPSLALTQTASSTQWQVEPANYPLGSGIVLTKRWEQTRTFVPQPMRLP